MYPDERVQRIVLENFVPARVHVRDQADQFRELGKRFGAQWTPTILVLDASGTEHHRIEGFLPPDDFLAELELGLGRMQFDSGDFEQAQKSFRAILEDYPESDAAAAALYWAGVSKYKASNDASALEETARAFQRRYRDTTWAKKASVWAK